jgi:hypothetical protein
MKNFLFFVFCFLFFFLIFFFSAFGCCCYINSVFAERTFGFGRFGCSWAKNDFKSFLIFFSAKQLQKTNKQTNMTAEICRFVLNIDVQTITAPVLKSTKVKKKTQFFQFEREYLFVFTNLVFIL